MKRFLMFLVIAIAVVSLGLTIYYFSVDNEVIYIKSSYLIINKNAHIQVTEGKNDLLEFRNKSEYTKLTYVVDQPENSNVLEFNSNENYFLAANGGEAKIIVKTSNRSFARLVVDVLVCDGSEEYPFMIRNETELENVDSDHSYKLANNIELTKEWTPLAEYNGVFDGNHLAINKMKITNTTAGSDVGFISVLGARGVIKNLFLTNVDIDVSNAINIGAFAGRSSGIVQTSEADGSIKNTNTLSSTTGGVVGKTLAGKIDRCGWDGDLIITGSGITAGGIVGDNSAKITESYARAKVNNGSSSTTYFGGIAGYTHVGEIYDCYFYARENIAAPSRAAGFFYDCNTTELITGLYYGGRISALANGPVKNDHGNALKSEANGYLNYDNFKIESKFITTKSNGSGYDRPWNFNGVWILPASEDYPLLNTNSTGGSTYIIDPGKIEPDDTIKTPDKLYNAMQRDDKNYDVVGNATTTLNGQTIKVLDMGGYVWVPITNFGDGDNVYNHAIVSKTGCIIRNFTIDASSLPNGSDVGMVTRMVTSGSNKAAFSGLIFENITIIGSAGKTYRYVGVAAGVSEGAYMANVSFNTISVRINGVAFGTIFGYADNATVINKIDIRNVNQSSVYYDYSGGVVGISFATISANANVSTSGAAGYNYIYNFSAVSNHAGGVAGANPGNITYTRVDNFIFDAGRSSTSNAVTNMYNSNRNIFVGGIVGTNDYTPTGGSKVKGYMSDVYANSTVTAVTGSGYKMYIGGAAGYNSSVINRAYVRSTSLTTENSHNAFVGGITGYNSGKIACCVTDANSKINTSINASVGTSVNGTTYILNTDNCSIVGGIVGYDTQTTNNFSVYKCASLMKEIKGYYAGGINGLSFGKTFYCYCGENTQSNGGVTIQGFLAGGLTSVCAGGVISNCYAVCRLNTAGGSGNYKDVLSVVKMEVSAVAGLAVFALNANSVIQCCYSVASFSSGVSYGSTAYLTGYTTCGKVACCVYQTAGSVATNNGTKLTQAELKGSNNYTKFRDIIRGDLSTWDFNSGYYPTIARVNVRNSASDLPKAI